MMIEDLNAQQAQLRDRVHEQMVQKIAQTATLAVSDTYCLLGHSTLRLVTSDNRFINISSNTLLLIMGRPR